MEKQQELSNLVLDLESLWAQAPKHELVVPYKELARFDQSPLLLSYASRERFDDDLDTTGIPLREDEGGLVYTLAIVETPELMGAQRVPRGGYLSGQELEDFAHDSVFGWTYGLDVTPQELEGMHGNTFSRVKKPLPHQVIDEPKQYVLPFLFTDFETVDQNVNEAFRDITAAKMLEEMFCVQPEESLVYLVEQRPRDLGKGMTTQAMYNVWTNELAKTKPFQDAQVIKRLEAKYGPLDVLDKYK